MTTEEIKTIVTDKEVERLTALFCHQWQVACERMNCLRKELSEGIDTNIEAEVYAALMRMQGGVMALMELAKKPCAFIFAESLDKCAKVIDNPLLHQAMTSLIKQYDEQNKATTASFLDFINSAMSQFVSLPAEQQADITQKVSALQQAFAMFAQTLQPEDLMMLVPLIQEIQAEGELANMKETSENLSKLRTTIDSITDSLASARLHLLILLLLLTILPAAILRQMMAWRADSSKMAPLLDKVLAQVRKGEPWEHYWEGRRQTLRVVSNSSSWNDTLRGELKKEKEILGQIPEGLFAKWSTDQEAFAADLLKAGLNDDAMRSFIFHLACVEELGRELNPFAKGGKERFANDERQTVCNAVIEAAGKLDDLVAGKWYPYFHNLWKDLLNEDALFERLKISRKSPHNNLFTARFFCHLVGGMKKSAVFGSHSDNDLAKKLVSSDSVITFRKNIQEGMDKEGTAEKEIFDQILLKYKHLASKR